MLTAKIKIKGIKPLVFHKFNIEALTALSKPKSGSSGNNPDEWRNSYFHDNGKLYIPDNYIFAALKNAAVHTKVGRGSIQKTWISAVNVLTSKAYLNREMFDDWEKISDQDVPTDSSLPVYIDVRMVANPNTKGRNVRYRVACSPGWETEFELLVDDTLISKQHIKKIVEDCGKLQGIAEMRTLGYGRFEVISIEFE